LDESERTRADRFRFAVDRETYVAAHALTRALLAYVDGLPSTQWRFTVTPAGKPEIAPALGRSGLHFSLSHTRGLVTCAVVLDFDLGIDVEADDGVRDVFDLAERFFAEDEVALLRGRTGDQLRKMFFRIWTLKEAYIKATGQGFARALDSFAFALDPPALRKLADSPEDAAGWQFEQFDVTPRHVISLAVRRAPVPLRVARRFVAFDEI
jgi:4'-phosphopantetheinyl transferase